MSPTARAEAHAVILHALSELRSHYRAALRHRRTLLRAPWTPAACQAYQALTDLAELERDTLALVAELVPHVRPSVAMAELAADLHALARAASLPTPG